MNDLVQKAFFFAIEKHNGQVYNGGAFFFHPLQVYGLVKDNRPDDYNLQAAALLHDTVEDTETTYEELWVEFGKDVADLVQEVTKDENKDFPHLSTARGLLLKAADRFANCCNLIGSEKEEKLTKKYTFCFKNEGTHRKELMPH